MAKWQSIPTEQIEEYITDMMIEKEYAEYDSRRFISEKICKLELLTDELKYGVNKLKKLFSADTPNVYHIELNMKENYKKMRSIKETISLIGGYSGFIKRERMIENNAVELEFRQEGQHLHIEFPELLPKRVSDTKSFFTYSDVREMYEPSFRKFFSEGKHIIYAEKAVIIYTHYFSDKYRLMDHENFETKTITDLITSSILLDDSPKLCSVFMDYKRGEHSHTEVDVIPFSQFKDFI